MKKGRVLRILGRVLYVGIGRFLPISYHRFGKASRKFRGFCAKLMIDQCGNNVNVERKAYFPNQIKLGDNSGIGINSSISPGTVIGNDVMMGPNCVIYTKNHRFDRTDVPMISQGFCDQKAVYIEDDVWIGGNVIILPGVHVGRGAVIGAGSVVTKDVAEFSVVAGNPARFIRFRRT